MILGRKPLGTVAYMGGIPAVLEEFCWSWGQMIAYNAEFVEDSTHYIHYDRVKYSDHAPARNTLVDRFYGDWLLMLDTDHEFEPDILRRMLYSLNTYNIDVLSGLYRFKKPPYSPVIYAYSPSGEGPSPIASWNKDIKILEIGASGAGCLLVRRKVYTTIRGTGEGAFDRFPGCSEDHSFFRRLKKLGIKSYCDMTIEAQHLRVLPVTERDEESGGMTSEPFLVDGF